jgi:hypothetical protein
MTTSRILLAFLLAASLAAAADSALLPYLPASAKLIAGIDIDRARDSAFGQRVLSQMKDQDQGFQKLMDATGFDPRRDLREVLLASAPGDSGERHIVAARGSFNPSKIRQFLTDQGGTSVLYKGVELWRAPEQKQPRPNAAAILNATVALFGDESLLRETIDRQGNLKTQLPQDVAGRVSAWSGRNDAWIVTTTSLSDLGVNADGKNKVMPGNLNIQGINQVSAGVRFGVSLDISGEAYARSDADAKALADVFRFVGAMIRLHAPNDQQALQIADSLKVDVRGITVSFSLTIPESVLDRGLKPTEKKQIVRRGPDVI